MLILTWSFGAGYSEISISGRLFEELWAAKLKEPSPDNCLCRVCIGNGC